MASFTDAHIEKAARALFAISSSNSLWEPLVDRAKEHWRRRARAVLEAVADDIARGERAKHAAWLNDTGLKLQNLDSRGRPYQGDNREPETVGRMMCRQAVAILEQETPDEC